MYMGLEVEAIISRYNKDLGDQQPIRARTVTRHVDGNDSVFEFNGKEHESLDYALESLQDAYMRAIKGIAASRGPLFCQKSNVNFIPSVIVTVKYEGVTIPLVKACGLHFHISGFPRRRVSKSKVSKKFNKLYKRFKHEAQIRRLPVIGPGTGRVYQYGKSSDLWRSKSGPGVRDWMEFRGIPSSSIVFDKTALNDLRDFLMFDGNIKESRIHRIVDACNTYRVDNIFETIINNGERNRSTVYFFEYDGMETFMGRPYKKEEMRSGWGNDVFVGVFGKGTSKKKMKATTKKDMVNISNSTFFIRRGEEGKFIHDFKNGKLDEDVYSINAYYYLKKSDFSHSVPPISKIANSRTLRGIPVYEEIQDVLRGKKEKHIDDVVERLKEEVNSKRRRPKREERGREVPEYIKRSGLSKIEFKF